MNKKKRILIMTAAIINIVCVTLNLAFAIYLTSYTGETIPDWAYYVYDTLYAITLHDSSSLIYCVICFALGLAGSGLLLWSVRSGGKHFRSSQGIYICGLAFVVIFGGWIPWILLLIQMFIPDVIVMNSRSELRREQREEVIEAQNLEKERNRTVEEKRKKIDELKKLRDDGVITEEEYKEKLFEIL